MNENTKLAFNDFLKALLAEGRIDDVIKLTKMYPVDAEAFNNDVLVEKVAGYGKGKAISIKNLINKGLQVSASTRDTIFEKLVSTNQFAAANNILALNPTAEKVKTLLSACKSKKPRYLVEFATQYNALLTTNEKVEFIEFLIKNKNFREACEYAIFTGQHDFLKTIAESVDIKYMTNYGRYHTRANKVGVICDLIIPIEPQTASVLLDLLVGYWVSHYDRRKALIWANKREQPGFTKDETGLLERYRL